MTEAVALHSGDYVERYKRKSLRRVRNLVDRMEIKDGAEIADFACGNGMLLQVVGTRKGAYQGIDFSADFIAAAEDWARQSQLSNWQFHCRDIVGFCHSRAASFDIATTLDFSEHVTDEDAIPIYAAIRSSLRAGGVLYLHTPNRDFILEALKDRGVLRQFPEHIAVRTPAQMRDLLVAAGFDRAKITIEAIPHYNVLAILHPLRRLPLVGRYFGARLWITARI